PEPPFSNQHPQAPIRPVRPAVVRLSAAGEGVFSDGADESQALFDRKMKKTALLHVFFAKALFLRVWRGRKIEAAARPAENRTFPKLKSPAFLAPALSNQHTRRLDLPKA
ncbi:hypothetical protein, partial [Shimia marina]|uniref:hypothetical protein n=1 Tax=Shimia marina TaxID=321267 RepID=UPI0018F7A2A5